MGQVKAELKALTLKGCEWVNSPSDQITGGNEVSGRLGLSGGLCVVAKRYNFYITKYENNVLISLVPHTIKIAQHFST